MKQKVKILIDSAATIDEKFIKDNDITVVPLSLSDSNNKVYADDGKQINHHILFNEIARGNTFKTSCTPIGQIMMAIEGALEKYDIVFFVPISYGLSSQYNTIKMLEEEHPGKLFVIKASSAAFANEYVYKKLVEYIKKYDDPKKIVEKCEDLYQCTDTYFSCEDVSGLVSGGRITQGIVKVIKLLKLKPIILLDIKNQRAGMSRNYKDNTKKIIDLIKEDYPYSIKASDIEMVNIYYSGYDDEKKEFLLDSFAKAFKYPKNKILVRWVPTVVLAHTRRGAYGYTICCKKPHKTRKINVD